MSRVKLAIATALTGFLILAGTTAGFAFWNASNTVSSTVGAATLSLSTTNFTSVGYTFGNDSLVTTGSVTVTNTTTTTSTQSGAVSLTFGPAVAGTTLAGKVTVALWTTASAANCTAGASVPSGATTALWSASTVLTASLAKNASVIYCVRSSIASRETVATSTGTLTFQPKISGTITVGNFTGSASATTTQSTQYIYPAQTTDVTHWNWVRPNYTTTTYDYCLDVSGGGGSNGSLVISYSCKTSGTDNENWKFTASGATGYYTIQPRSATGLRVDDNSSTTSGGGVTVNTAAGAPATAKNQQWQLQLVSTGIYEMVNAYSGMCLTSPGGTAANLGQLTQAPCSGSSLQQFVVSQTLENFTCKVTGNNWVWSWDSTTTGPYHVLVTHGTTTTELVTTAQTASSATLPFSAVSSYNNSPYTVTFVDGNGTTVGAGTATTTFFNLNNTCSASNFA